MKLRYFLPVILPVMVMMSMAGCQLDPETRQKIAALQAQHQRQLQGMTQLQNDIKQLSDDSPIVYVDMVGDQAQLFLTGKDGQQRRQLTSVPGYKCRPSWSLDHHHIAFFHYQSNRPLDDYVDIAVIDADGSNLREVVKNKKIDTKKIRISWHPQGHTLYVQEKDFPAMLFGYSVETGQQVDTVRLPKNTFMTEVHTLSPNFELLAGEGPSKQDGIMHVGTIRRDGQKETDLMRPFMKVSYHLGTVVWSYHSDLIAFELDNIVMVMSSSFRLDFKAYVITPQDFDAQISQPAISPTGKYLAAVMEQTEEGHRGSGDTEVISNIWVMNIDGTKQVPITTSGTCFDPHW